MFPQTLGRGESLQQQEWDTPPLHTPARWDAGDTVNPMVTNSRPPPRLAGGPTAHGGAGPAPGRGGDAAMPHGANRATAAPRHPPTPRGPPTPTSPGRTRAFQGKKDPCPRAISRSPGPGDDGVRLLPQTGQ